MPDATSQNAVEFRDVSLSFEDKPALIDVSFKLCWGEMIFITGESSAGKSVLLLLAMGLLKPDSGQIFIGGVEIETLNESALLAIRGGLMGNGFSGRFAVYGNVRFRKRRLPTRGAWLD